MSIICVNFFIDNCISALCDKNKNFLRTFKKLGYDEETEEFDSNLQKKDVKVPTNEEIISSLEVCLHYKEKRLLPGLYFWLTYFINEASYDGVKCILEIPEFDINKKYFLFNDYTAIDYAIDAFIWKPISNSNRFNIIKLLLEKGSILNYPVEVNNIIIPCLFFPASHLKRDLVKLLLNHGADINAKSDCHEGYSILHYLIKFTLPDTAHENMVKEKIKMIRLLGSNGANINATLKSNGFTPLHLLIDVERTNLVKLMSVLLDGLAYVNAKTNDENAVIHCLVNKYISFINDLVTAEANVANERTDSENIENRNTDGQSYNSRNVNNGEIINEINTNIGGQSYNNRNDANGEIINELSTNTGGQSNNNRNDANGEIINELNTNTGGQINNNRNTAANYENAHGQCSSNINTTVFHDESADGHSTYNGNTSGQSTTNRTATINYDTNIRNIALSDENAYSSGLDNRYTAINHDLQSSNNRIIAINYENTDGQNPNNGNTTNNDENRNTTNNDENSNGQNTINRNTDDGKIIHDKYINGSNADDVEDNDQIYKTELYSGLKLLIEYDVNPNTKDKDGNTALHLILNMKNYDPSASNMIYALIESGADIDIKNNAGASVSDIFIANLNTYPIRTFCQILNRFANLENGNTCSKSSSLHMLFELCLEKLGIENFLESMTHLIQDGADVNAKDTNENTVLHLLVTKFFDKFDINDHTRALKILINHGADVTIKNKEGLTPLMILSNEPKYQPDSFIDVLQRAMAHLTVTEDNKDLQDVKDINKKENQKTIISDAIIPDLVASGSSNPSRETRKYLKPRSTICSIAFVEKVKDKERDYSQSTRLHQLFYKLSELNDLTIELRIGMMKVLISSGIDVNAKDIDGNTALLILLLPQNKIRDESLLLVIDFLINSGADVNVENNEKLSPLLLTVISSYSFETQLIVLTRLVDEGANIYKSSILERVMQDLNLERLILWTRNHNLKQLTSLCKLFSRLVDRPDSEGLTPLFHAARNCHFEFVKALVQEGAKVDRICNGRSVIQELMKSKHLEDDRTFVKIVKYLIEKGVDLNHKDSNGNTVCHSILARHFYPSNQWYYIAYKITELILDSGFNCNIKDLKGKTVLDLLIKISSNNRNEFEDILRVFCQYLFKIEIMTGQNLRAESIWGDILQIYKKTEIFNLEIFSDYEKECKKEIEKMKAYLVGNTHWLCVSDRNVSFYDLFSVPLSKLSQMSVFNDYKLSNLELFEDYFYVYGVVIYHKIRCVQKQQEILNLGG